MKNINVPMMFK